MKSTNRRKPLCPSDARFEQLSLDSYSIEEDKKRVQIHLQQCNGCRKRFQEFDGFYSFFLQEISKPITNSALDFAKSIGHNDVKYGLLECEPLLDETNGHGFAYRAHLRFMANGSPNSQKLADFNSDKKLSPNLVIRFMTDPTCGKILLFIQSIEMYSFKNYRISIPGIADSVQLNNAGAAKLEMIDINKLIEQIIYLQKDETNSTSYEKRVDKIRNSIGV